jgi:hypothetical protein
MTHGPLTLQDLTGEHTPAPAGIAVSPAVLDAAARTATDYIERRHCRLCGQSIYTVSKNHAVYSYTADEVLGLIAAHMIQCHGWTREVPGV